MKSYKINVSEPGDLSEEGFNYVCISNPSEEMVDLACKGISPFELWGDSIVAVFDLPASPRFIHDFLNEYNKECGPQ